MEIKLQNIRKRFGETVALDDLSLEFCDGKLTTLLGPSGCGKSTLLNLISGILPPTSGSIYFGDRDVTSLSPDKRNIGLVFQNYALYPHMTVGENIAFSLEIKKVSKKERMERAAEFAKLLRIEDYFTRKPSQLSGGQQQRVAIARALAKEPEILLLDEPLSNLALSISDHILLLKKGRIQQYGLPQELYDEPCNPFVADFLGNPPINLYEGIVDGNRVILQGDNTGFLIAGMKGIERGRRVKLGIRSEAFEAAAEGVYETPATVRNVFLNGKETLYLLEIGGKEFRSTLESGQTYEIGGKISVRLKKKGVHIYDSETEEKIG